MIFDESKHLFTFIWIFYRSKDDINGLTSVISQIIYKK